MAQTQQCIEYHCKINQIEKDASKIDKKLDELDKWIKGLLISSIGTLIGILTIILTR